MNLKVIKINPDLFNIDLNDIKIKSNDIDLKLRNSLKDLINDKMSNLISQSKKVLANLNKEDLLKLLEDLRLITRYILFTRVIVVLINYQNT
jgi:hypothetical protein